MSMMGCLELTVFKTERENFGVQHTVNKRCKELMLSDNKNVQVVQVESTQVTQIAFGLGLHGF